MRVTKQDVKMANLWRMLEVLEPRDADIVVEQIEFSKAVDDFQTKTDMSTCDLCQLIDLCKDFHYSKDTKEGYELLFGGQDFDAYEEDGSKIVAVHTFTCKTQSHNHEQSGYFLEFEDGKFNCSVMQSEYYGDSYTEALNFLITEWLS